MTLYEKFKKMDADTSLIGIEKGNEEGDYFCTPIGAKVIGWENGGIHYCFIEGFGEKVFAVNPETASEHFVRPLAENFEEFLMVVLACKGTTAAEQITDWTKEQFEAFLDEDTGDFAEKREKVLEKICSELKIEPMKNVFEYVKKLQEDFDYTKLKYSSEYYDVLGLEPPEGMETLHREEVSFEAEVFVVLKR